MESFKNRKGISSEFDSLTNRTFSDQRQQLQTDKKISKIEKLLIGNWRQSKSVRINGQVENIPKRPDIHFSNNGRFQTTRGEKIVGGRYFITKEGNYNLKLIFDEPQLPPFPKEMLRKMTQKEIQEMLYNEELWNIFEIDKNQFITYEVIPIFNPENPSILTHSRLRLEYYTEN